MSAFSCNAFAISVFINPISCFNPDNFSSKSFDKLLEAISFTDVNKPSNFSSKCKTFSFNFSLIPSDKELLTESRSLIILLIPVSIEATVSVNFSSEDNFIDFNESFNSDNSVFTSVISSTEDAIFASVSDALPSIIWANSDSFPCNKSIF